MWEVVLSHLLAVCGWLSCNYNIEMSVAGIAIQAVCIIDRLHMFTVHDTSAQHVSYFV